MGMFKDKDYDQVIGMTAPLARRLYEFLHGDVVKKTDMLAGGK